ncbi:GNAT family N-acetyltransferase [Pigmentibacter ruber]|uniref:GNAT family N-acetyltransferase n=1 Tax=Pigmentibacter ruber TaxID=2683196 RepID=UPI00131B82E2|nr:GNAT family protein [Pigmentibacter ruber]BFD30656.1 GNAT family N-acetyltransferase [Pigmentibacter ruber]
MISINTNRFNLRTLCEKDSNDIFQFTKDPEISKYLNWESHKDIHDTNDYLTRIILLTKKFPISNLGIEVIDKNRKTIIGTVGLLPKHISSPYTYELGFVLSKEWWGKGIAIQSVQCLMKYAFENYTLERIEAFCVTENLKSWALLEKIGMLREGTRRNFFYKDKSFYDLYMYSILKNEWKEPSH